MVRQIWILRGENTKVAYKVRIVSDGKVSSEHIFPTYPAYIDFVYQNSFRLSEKYPKHYYENGYAVVELKAKA